MPDKELKPHRECSFFLVTAGTPLKGAGNPRRPYQPFILECQLLDSETGAECRALPQMTHERSLGLGCALGVAGWSFP